jgi:hypothetical protein
MNQTHGQAKWTECLFRGNDFGTGTAFGNVNILPIAYQFFTYEKKRADRARHTKLPASAQFTAPLLVKELDAVQSDCISDSDL